MAKVTAVDLLGRVAVPDVPNGVYPGVWCGAEVFAVLGKDRYRFVTEECIRGTGVGCTVTVRNGDITVEAE